MKKGMILSLLGLAFFVSLGVADDLVPVAVSPGAENGPAVVRQSCPTFSWTAVSWALTYKVVVFEAGDGETPAYEKIAAEASPVLIKEIPGKAFSWTPSADEPLINGGSYVWYVGAMVNAAQGSWSEGRKFIIAENPAWGVVSEPRDDGIGAGGSRRQILRDQDFEMTAAVKQNFNLTDDPLSQGLIDIEGTEIGVNTYYGENAGNTTMTGAYNSFFGNLAGNKNTSGYGNTFLGTAAGYLNTTGFTNTFVGRSAGQHNTTASNNTFLGYATGCLNTTGDSNTFVGYLAGYLTTTGANNVFVGRSAGEKNTAASGNTFIGYLAGNKNTEGSSNTFVGYTAGSNNNQDANTFLGYAAGFSNTGGLYNSFTGYGAGYSNTVGGRNICVGAWTGYANTKGERNTFLGQGAGSNNTIGECNTFVGQATGGSNITGSRNVFLGYCAGFQETGSDKLYIDNSQTTTPLIYGNFNLNRVGINNNAPGYMFVVGTGGAYCNGTTWVNGSSREFKENIEELTAIEALQAIADLEPVKFNYKENKEETYLGFIAEDVPDLVAMNDRKGLNPMDIVAMLTKVVQEQQKAITSLQEKISKLEKRSRKEK
jgi:hypothetical protein